jgi:transcriptional regulator with XRE-family HTH domain
MDFKAAREARKLTLKQVSELAGYSVPTINALELEGRGSDRLKEKLREIYNLNDELSQGMVLREESQVSETEIWKRRAKAAEKELSELKDRLRGLLSRNITEAAPAKDEVHTAAGNMLGKATSKLHERK